VVKAGETPQTTRSLRVRLETEDAAVLLYSASDIVMLDADGVAEPRVQVLGSLRIGRLWESLAIPELRVQAAQAAARLLPPRG